MFSREIPSDSRKCSHTISFLTRWRASIRSVSNNCASFMAWGNTKNRGPLIVLFYAHHRAARYSFRGSFVQPLQTHIAATESGLLCGQILAMAATHVAHRSHVPRRSHVAHR